MSSFVHMFFGNSLSDDDNEFDVAIALLADVESNKRRKHGGSVTPRVVVRRNKQQGHDKLFNDYFTESPVFDPTTFRRRFIMSKELFFIANAMEAYCPYFAQKRNAAGDLGHSALKKITVAVRILAYGGAHP